MLRDEDLFPITTSAPIAHMNINNTDESLLHADDRGDEDYTHVNDDLDDVFGSEPSSPSPADDDPSQERLERAANFLEPSDVPRLREKHHTEGYRDGVTQGKAQSIQAGFDEGYTLGAVLGLRIGKILGLLDGILAGVSSAASNAKAGAEVELGEEKQRLETLWALARQELDTASVFGRAYWGEDGIWIFEVPGEKDDGGEVVFEDVVSAHPLVRKWAAIVEEECVRWGVDLDVMAGEGEGDVEDVQESKDPGRGMTVSGKQKQKREEAKPVNESTTEPTPGSASSSSSPAVGKIMGVSKEQLNW